MEAATLQKKKNTISKGKMKKNIKNVICRPDQVFWPEINEEQRKLIEKVLNKYKIKILEFKKPHWKELKLIPKDKRPKPPTLKKVEGLLFGISECSSTIKEDKCSAIIIEALVNPRMIVQPVIEMCISKNIPVICMTGLRKLTLENFGLKTSCLGIRKELILDVRDEIKEISKSYARNKPDEKVCVKEVKMDVENQIKQEPMDITESINEFKYLYRTNKKSRIFVPNADVKTIKTETKKFVGQDFIEFSDKQSSKAYMKMIVKRISNNPERVKKK